jgi:hypothetical protein
MQGYRPAPALPITKTCPANEAWLHPEIAPITLTTFPMVTEVVGNVRRGKRKSPPNVLHGKLKVN